jgi:hypothetical protein
MFTPGIMDEIRIVPGPEYPGTGISRGLARGLLVYYGDCNLTGEGMGIGSIAVRDHEYTYFSRSWTDSAEAGVLRRTFALDTRMSWSIRGKPSAVLTRGIESGVSAYMRLPRFQDLLMVPVFPLRTQLGIHPVFETIPARGEITFTYRVSGSHVGVHAEMNLPVRQQDTVCLLNELSAAWFTKGCDGECLVPPPPGWEKVDPGQLPAPLADPVHGIRFSLSSPEVNPPVPFTLFRGREYNGDHCWTGFCIQLDTPDDVQGLPGVHYSVDFTTGEYS